MRLTHSGAKNHKLYCQDPLEMGRETLKQTNKQTKENSYKKASELSPAQKACHQQKGLIQKFCSEAMEGPLTPRKR